ncbi:hypothetical protein J8F10_23420 [Gemmata sp. G18]|uniref:ABC transporter substrate-binding protein n=1 Tax=Gemmata palustris TaxID=2822762 RepID=A0ABS5BWV2_9BACT|nr:hypothetical protein [Gemmata palustris]MBP3958209.1 hypothetical protein [Gemmata palustris]
MKRSVVRVTVSGFLLALVMSTVGCGSDGKEVNPKAPADAPKLEMKTPAGAGKSAPKGKSD